MKWRKLGQVFSPDRHHPWMVSHASNPVAEHLGGNHLRVYFSCRDSANRSSVGFVEIDLQNPRKVDRVSERPLLSPGLPGRFDESGVTIGCLVSPEDGPKRLYYLGWKLCQTVPWRNQIGLATANAAEESFERHAPEPIVPLDAVDPHTLTYPWVLREGTRWRLWYGSNTTWGPTVAHARHVIKYAESDDGVTFRRDGQVVLDLKPPETVICRPCVLRGRNGYQMWFSYRGAAYRIGYAVSSDGVQWTRRDEEVGITVSDSGWDSEMIEYPSVFDHGGERYLLYNGNGHGRTGFGLAILQQD